uniref:Endonuclease/exonuclease/phosphatase domain-containing protein n=1 Tax=Cyclopterus lumpus TaxID=8103 RepID=A0A8C2XNR7_CYCLU
MSSWPSKVTSIPTKFTSWNVKGVNNPVKRQRVMSHLQQLTVDVAFLQETHLCKIGLARWSIPDLMQRHPKEIISDPNGRYVIVTGQLWANPVILVNVIKMFFNNYSFTKTCLILLHKFPVFMLNSLEPVQSAVWKMIERVLFFGL